MSDYKDNGGPLARNITLSHEQFERLYLQPGGAKSKGDAAARFGNPTPLGIAGFLLCLTPISVYLMGFGATTAGSTVGQTGPYYFLGGLCLIIAGILEWAIGNTFPSVVFATFGGFYLSNGISNDPMHNIASFYGGGNPTLGAESAVFNSGQAVYLLCWGCLTVIYLIASLRTNVMFVILFASLASGFFVLSAAYFDLAKGVDPTHLLTASGALFFVTSLCGWWLMLAVTLGSTGIPLKIPVGDLSNFLGPRNRESEVAV